MADYHDENFTTRLTQTGNKHTILPSISGCSAAWPAHLHGVQGVGGSNPLTQIPFKKTVLITKSGVIDD